jgi:hypothetical protein
VLRIVFGKGWTVKISVEHLFQAESALSFNRVLTVDFVGRFKKPLFPDGLAVTGSVENRTGVVTLDYRAQRNNRL